MADTVEVKYIYPPNFDLAPNTEDHSGTRRVCVQLTSTSDGTGETDVKKVDISELRMPDGLPPTRTAVEKIDYMISGMTVKLEWDRAPNSVIALLDGSNGCISWQQLGGKVDPSGEGDRTGDILLTTTGADSGDTYDITMWIKLKR